MAIEAVDAVRRRLAVEVPEGEVAQEIERAYSRLRRTAAVRGFRQGRAPRAVLERVFGDQVRAEVFGNLVRSSFREALREQNIDPVGEPEIVTERAEPGASLRYSATIEVKPTIEAINYDGLEAERPLRRVDEADIERVLRDLRESLAQLHPILDRTVAQPGDMATVDVTVRDGQRIVARSENHLHAVGGETTVDPIGPQLVGLVLGAVREFTVEEPAAPSDEAVARALTYEVSLKALASKELPPLDDEFAKDHGDCRTLDELRARIRMRLEAVAASDADGALRASLLDRLVKAHDFAVPRALVEQRREALFAELFDRMGTNRPGVPREAALREQWRADVEERARQQVKGMLVLEAIARQERLAVSEEDVEAHIDALAARAGGARDQLLAAHQDPHLRAGVRARLLQARALDVVVGRAHVRTVESTSSIAGGERNG